MIRKWVARVVIASPGDVQEERDAVERAITHVNFNLKVADAPVVLEPWRYEKDARPGLHPRGPQALIESLLRIEQSDLLIGIFWRRFGTRTNDAASGTESEIRNAIGSWKSQGTPDVMLYFKTTPVVQQSLEEERQFEAVQAFKQELLTTVKPLVTEYDNTPEQFETLVANHLSMFAAQLIRESSDADLESLSFKLLPVKPTLLRAEGITELLGDLFLQCRWNDTRPPKYTPWFSVNISLVAQVTSRVRRGSDSYAGPRLAEIGPSSSTTDMHITGYDANFVVFASIWVNGIQPHETRTYQIGNIRCNANAIGRGEVFGVVSVNGAPIENGGQVIARIVPGLEFEIMDLDGSRTLTDFTIYQSEGLPLSRIATLRFLEGYPGSFKSKLPLVTGTSPRDTTVLTTESYTSGSIVELADSGTCLKVAFCNLPTGVRFFVALNEAPNNFGLQAQVIDSISTVKSTEVTEIEGIRVRELDVADQNFTEVVWEVIHPSANSTRRKTSLDFAVFASCKPDSDQKLPSLGMATVNGSFAPTSTVTTVSALDPIPRFIDTSKARHLVTVKRLEPRSIQ
jgi:hypothetical protein